MSDFAHINLQINADAKPVIEATQQASASVQKLKVDLSDLTEREKIRWGLQAEKKPIITASPREIKTAGNELGKAAGLGAMGDLMLSPPGAAAAGAAASLELLHSTWESVNAGNKGEINLVVHGDPAKVQEAASILNEYAAARKKVLDTYESVEAAEGREEKALGAKLQLLGQVLKAEEAEALAVLATHKDNLTPQAYAAAVASVQQSFAGQREDMAENGEQQKIDAKRAEAVALAADAANKRKQAQAIAGSADARGAAEENGESAHDALKNINGILALVQRVQGRQQGKGIPEYQGGAGILQAATDIKDYYTHFGLRRSAEVMADLQLQKSQALAAIDLAARARTSGERGKNLVTEAGEESGRAEVMRQEADQDQRDFDNRRQVRAGTGVLDTVSAALGRQHDAEQNQTAHGTREAQAALQAGVAAAAKAQAQIKSVGESNKELHSALEKAFADITAENRRLAKLIKNLPISGR